MVTISLYARSDVCSVAVPVTSGGCGATHLREVTRGAPAKIFKLDCASCEQLLRTDPLWSATLSEIPETHDEARTREDFEKRRVYDQQGIMALALGKIAGVEIPETLRQPLSAIAPHIPTVSGQIECEHGHANKPGMKFCGECGLPLHAPVRMCPDGHEVAARMRFCGECGKPAAAPAALDAAPADTVPADAGPKRRLRDMRAGELKAMARGRGLDDSGTRTDVLARLQAA